MIWRLWWFIINKTKKIMVKRGWKQMRYQNKNAIQIQYNFPLLVAKHNSHIPFKSFMLWKKLVISWSIYWKHINEQAYSLASRGSHTLTILVTKLWLDRLTKTNVIPSPTTHFMHILIYIIRSSKQDIH